MNSSQSRRQFLKFVSSQSAALGLSPLLLSGLSSCVSTPSSKILQGLSPSHEDKLRLTEGLNYHIICQWGEVINSAGDAFGFNNDFTSFLPLNGSDSEGLLWVNHESVIPEFIHNKNSHELTRSKKEIIAEQKMVGGSILHIKKRDGKWKIQKDSSYNRRLDALTQIPFSHGHKIQGSTSAQGTLANCAGGQTPWKTFLTSEENYDIFYGEATLVKGKRSVGDFKKMGWHKQFPLPPEHYGWIVEVDPMTGKAEKQVLLGRAPHEGATVALTRKGKAVVYMGEDREFGFLFKFVSTGSRFKNGTLYAADTINGRWLPLDLEKSSALKSNFKTQLEVLTYAHQAAELVGATPQDRPEDIEINKKNGDVFVALTKNSKTGNHYGGLLKIVENDDHDSLTFQSEIWLSGGLESGMACPDNLCFDKNGNLWVTNDISEKLTKTPRYNMFGNNGLYYIPLSGPGAGHPILVASAPVDAELTGPWFSEDYKTLFLSVQHPGSRSKKDMTQAPTSDWPNGQGKMPRPSVVAIQGDLFDRLMK